MEFQIFKINGESREIFAIISIPVSAISENNSSGDIHNFWEFQPDKPGEMVIIIIIIIVIIILITLTLNVIITISNL